MRIARLRSCARGFNAASFLLEKAPAISPPPSVAFSLSQLYLSYYLLGYYCSSTGNFSWKMTSVMAPAPQSADIKPTVSVARIKPVMSPVQEPTPPENTKQEDTYSIKQEDDPDRDRHRSQSEEKDDDLDNDESKLDLDGNPATGSNSDEPARKRRRSRKCLDKKFECPEAGCGKSYSRAEHLYEEISSVSSLPLSRCHRTYANNSESAIVTN